MTAGLFPPQVIYRLLKIRRWRREDLPTGADNAAHPLRRGAAHLPQLRQLAPRICRCLCAKRTRRWAAWAAAELGHIDRWLSRWSSLLHSLHCGIAAEAFVIS